MYKNHKPLSINVVPDIHFYSKKLGTSGIDFEKETAKCPNDLANNEAILEAVFRQLEKDEAEIVIFPGDLTFNAEPESHEGVIKLLSKLKASGKKVYTLTATHDFRGNDKTFSYVGSKHEIDAVKRSELLKMYKDFGPDESIAIHPESMSYVVQLCDGYRLFALNDDKNGEGSSGFSTDCFRWISSQIAQAKKDNQFVIIMTHHPMIPPSPFYKIIAEGDMMGDCEKRCSQFADMGVCFALTGHTHMEDVSYVYSEKGNIFYDITTASPVGYPATYRTITFDPAERKIDVASREITEPVDFELNGKNLKEHLENKFFGMIKDIIYAAAYNTDKLAKMAHSFSVKSELVYRFAWLLKPIAWILLHLKIKHVAPLSRRETGLKKSDYANIKNEKVVDFIISLIMNLYAGDAPYMPDSAYYKITIGTCNVIDNLLSTVGLSINKFLKNATSLRQIVEPLLFNAGIPDRNVTLKIYPLYSPENPAPERIQNKSIECDVKDSKKGPLIIGLTVLCFIILLPLILLYLILGFLINFIVNFRKIRAEEEKEDNDEESKS